MTTSSYSNDEDWVLQGVLYVLVLNRSSTYSGLLVTVPVLSTSGAMISRRRHPSTMSFNSVVLTAACLLSCSRAVAGLNNGLAPTPPMGYNTWNAFHDEINETLIYHAADELVETGLAAAGYVYLIIDGAYLAPSYLNPTPDARFILHPIASRSCLEIARTYGRRSTSP